jgi:iron(III) transport system ATP-binding protein
MSSLILRAVTKRYGSVVALNAVDLSVPAGSRTAIVGPSGSGKTTLLRIIAGFEAPDAGRVTLAGENLADGPDIIPAYRRRIGVVMQDGALFPHLSIADNIGFALERGSSHRARRIVELMRMVELDVAMLDRRPDELSGGQQQRVAIARALAREPRLMLLDEPFSALDAGLRATTRKMVANLLADAGVITILVTHDQAEALSFADQVAVVENGELLQSGKPYELYLRPRSPMIAEFLGEAIIQPALLADGHADCALGRIPVAHPQKRGVATIMLRPEQISLAPVAPDALSSCNVTRGEVVDIDFGGATCAVSLSLLNTTQTLVLQRTHIEVPAIGTIVSITIAGMAHVFEAPAQGCVA